MRSRGLRELSYNAQRLARDGTGGCRVLQATATGEIDTGSAYQGALTCCKVGQCVLSSESAAAAATTAITLTVTAPPPIWLTALASSPRKRKTDRIGKAVPVEPVERSIFLSPSVFTCDTCEPLDCCRRLGSPVPSCLAVSKLLSLSLCLCLVRFLGTIDTSSS